jgi:hypothetical protein
METGEEMWSLNLPLREKAFFENFARRGKAPPWKVKP